MEAVTETKQGYKKTKIGWIPEDWENIPFSDVYSFLKTFSFSRDKLSNEETNDRIKYIHYGDIHTKFSSSLLDASRNDIPYLHDNIIDISDFEEEKFPNLKNGDLIIADASEDYEGVCDCTEICNLTNEKVISGLHTFAARPNKIGVAPGFGNYILKNSGVKKELKRIATGISVYGVSKSNLSKVYLYLPPLPEQQKIAQILSTWDKAIEQNQNLIEQLKSRKKGLMQQLLTGKTRLKGFSGEWKEVKLGKYLVFYKNKSNSSDTYPVFSSSKKGLIMQSDYYGGDNRITSRDIDGFNIIPPEYATYRSRSDDGVFTFNSNNHGITGVVSKYYPVFKCIESNQNFIIQTLNYHHYKVRRYAVGTSQLVLSEKDLKQLKFNLPCHEEQNAINEVLTIADKEIKTQETYLQQLQDQKKGLMQQLLTGQKRVNVNN